MKVLHLMRHGKSSWESESIRDIDRPLLERGIRSSYAMAERCLKDYPVTDLIICSSANRAMHTASIFARVAKYPMNKLVVTEELYEAEMETILDLITSTDNSVNNLLLVGHNPGFTDAANEFLRPRIDNVNTSGIVSIQFQCNDWSQVRSAEHKANFYSPKTE